MKRKRFKTEGALVKAAIANILKREQPTAKVKESRFDKFWRLVHR